LLYSGNDHMTTTEGHEDAHRRPDHLDYHLRPWLRCADCRWAVRRAEDRIESGRALDNTFTLNIRYYGHDAVATRLHE
jgi:hypothetical protein